MFATSKATLSALASLGRWVRPAPGRIAGTVALMLVGGSLEGATLALLVPLLTMLTGSAGESSSVEARLDFLLGGFSTEMKVVVLGIALVVVVAAKNTISFAGVYSAGVLRSRAMIALRRQLLGTLLHAPPVLLERQTSGEIANVFVTEATRINRVLDLCVSLVMRTIVATSYLVALLVLSWQLTLVTAVLAVVLGAVSSWLGARALRLGRQFTAANSALSRHITELVGGLRVVRTTATEAVREESFEQPNRAHAEADVGASMSQALQIGATETLAIAGAMGLTALAYKVWFGAGAMSAATFLAFGFGLIRLLPALSQIYAGQGFLTPLVGSVEHVVRWLELPRFPERPFGTASVPHLEKGIRFENLSFAYSDGHEAVRSLSFFLPAGATLAVLGPSGSGKSTFAALLLRLREPSRGTIELDGTDYWAFSPESYHRAVAFVEQEPFLFNASVFENVTCGEPSIGREAVKKALELAQLNDVIARLPQGIDTVLAERGSTLSGGQRQRLAIARAIVRDPQLLVLDEPTSALDPDTEREVVRAISAAARGRTTILIAHRASTVEHAQYVLRFADGRASIDSTDAPQAPLKKAADAS